MPMHFTPNFLYPTKGLSLEMAQLNK